MHETGVCRSIVETVEHFALAGHAKRVKTVRIKLGEVHDVVPEILIGAFGWMARGTVAEGAEMVIERIPFTVKCELCGEVYRLDVHDERTWDCPACHQRAYHLHTGREFLIDAIEIENYAPGETDDSAYRLERLQAERRRSASDLAVSGRRPAGAPSVPLTGRAAAAHPLQPASAPARYECKLDAM